MIAERIFSLNLLMIGVAMSLLFTTGCLEGGGTNQAGGEGPIGIASPSGWEINVSGITKETNVVISGSGLNIVGQADAFIYSDASCQTKVGTARITNGRFALNLNYNSDGTHDGEKKFYGRVKGPTGVTSIGCPNLNLDFELDTQDPTIPGGWVMDTPAKDAVSNDSSPAFTATAPVEEAGGTAIISYDNQCTTTAATAIVASDGSINFTTALPTDGSIDGTLQFYGQIVDLALNTSDCELITDATYVYDRTPPLDPNIGSYTLASPLDSTLSNDSSPDFTAVEPAAEENGSVEIHIDAGCSGAIGSGTIDGTGNAAFTATLLTDGTQDSSDLSFYARVVDEAGNPSTCLDTLLGYNYDSQPPAPPAGWTLSGITSNPSINNKPTVSGTGIDVSEDGGYAYVYVTNACGTPVGSKILAGGSFTADNISLMNNISDPTAVYIFGKLVDKAGNATACTNMLLGYNLGPEVVFRKNGNQSDYLGYSLAYLQYDGVGGTDIAIGAPKNYSGGLGGWAGVWKDNPANTNGAVLMTKSDPGSPGVGQFGFGVGNAGDYDGDGADEIIIGTYDQGYTNNTPNNYSASEWVQIYSYDGGANAGKNLVKSWDNPANQSGMFGYSVSGVMVGGVQKVIVGAAAHGNNDPISYIRRYSYDAGVNTMEQEITQQSLAGGGTLKSDSLGGRVVQIGDYDGNGTSDYAVGAFGWPNSTGQGRVYIFSGDDNSLIDTIDGTGNVMFGFRIVDMGDLTGDGRDDLLITAHAQRGYSYVYSYNGTTSVHQAAYFKQGAAVGDNFGSGAANVGDINGDGVTDFAIGAWKAEASGGTDRGKVYFYSGADGTELWVLKGPTNFAFCGLALVGGRDFDGDGDNDVFFGCSGYNNNSGRVEGYSLKF